MEQQRKKIIIESLLTGSQFELTIGELDKILVVKSNIQKVLGIPSNQIHLLYNQTELNDSMLLKDIPNFHEGIRLKLVLGMKVGPISSARRFPLTDYDSWFDDVIHQNSKREEPLTIKTKYLVYKGCKKNVHRLWKMNGSDGKGKSTSSASGHNSKYGGGGGSSGGGGKSSSSSSTSFFGSLGGRDDDKIKKMTDQTIQENIRTTEKVNQLRLKMELVNARKKLKSIKFPIKSKTNNSSSNKNADASTPSPPSLSGSKAKQMSEKNVTKEAIIEKPIIITTTKTKDTFIDKVVQKQPKAESRNLSAESRMKIKENLSRNRSFKTIMSQPAITTSSSSMSLFNNDLNPLEFCFSGGSNGGSDIFASTASGSKLGRSLSFQSNYILNRNDSNLCVNSSSLTAIESNSTPIIQEYVEHTTICPTSSSASSASAAAATATAIGAKIKDPLPKSGYSTSMQDLFLQDLFLTKSPPTSAHVQLAASSSASISASSALTLPDDKIDMFKGTAITKVSSGDEYFILPKLLVREDSPSVLESSLGVVKESKTEELLEIGVGKQPSAESLIEFYENLTSSSTSSLASKINDFECFHHPPASANRFYHSDLDLNQLNDRFKNNLSISNQNINTSEGNLGGSDAEWPRSNLLLLSINQTIKDEQLQQQQQQQQHQPQPNDYNNLIEDVNYDKFLNDLLNNDLGSGVPTAVFSSDHGGGGGKGRDYVDAAGAVGGRKGAFSDEKPNDINNKTITKDSNSEMIDLFGSDLDSVLTKKMTARRIAPLKKPIDKLKSFSSNPQLGNHNTLSTHESSNLTATATTSTTTVHIPQLSRLDAIPTKYRRGYINLNDACLSNSDLSTPATTAMPSSSSTLSSSNKMSKTDRKLSLPKESTANFHLGTTLLHCQNNKDALDINERIPQTPTTLDCFDSGAGTSSSGRQSRFEYCNSYYSNLNQFPSTSSTHHRNSKASDGANFDFQSEENLFNMNFDSFYEDFVDSAELSWSSTSSASSTSFDSSSISSMYDKKYVILPEIKLDDELLKADDKVLMVAAAAAAAKEKEPIASTSSAAACNVLQQQQKESSGKLRCYHCNKKLGIIMIMKCHCNQYFCPAHKYSEVHNCSYDYKEQGRKKLQRENPLVSSHKLPKI